MITPKEAKEISQQAIQRQFLQWQADTVSEIYEGIKRSAENGRRCLYMDTDPNEPFQSHWVCIMKMLIDEGWEVTLDNYNNVMTVSW